MARSLHPCSYKIDISTSTTFTEHFDWPDLVDISDSEWSLSNWTSSSQASTDRRFMYSSFSSISSSPTSTDPIESGRSKDLTENLLNLNTIAYFYITPIIIVCGIVGDVMSISVLSHPLLRKTSVVYCYLLALAITDLLTLISVIPPILWIMKIKLCTLTAARYYAHVGFPLANAFMGASVYIVVFLTFNQYMAVCHPFLCTDFIRSRRNCVKLTFVAYALSFTLYVPWGWRKYARHVGDLHYSFQNCPYEACDNHIFMDSFWYKTYQWTREVISRIIPFLFIAYFNLRILYVYRRTRTQRMNVVGLREQKQTLRQKTEREQRRLWGLLFGIMSLFFICTIPAAPFTIMVSDRLESNLTFQTIRAITNVLEFTKFALNFYLYCMVNPDIRRLCLKRLTCQSAFDALRTPMVHSRHSYHLGDLLQMSERRKCTLKQEKERRGTVTMTRTASNSSNKQKRSFRSRVDSEKPLLRAGTDRRTDRYMAMSSLRITGDESGRDSRASPTTVTTTLVQTSPAADTPWHQNGLGQENYWRPTMDSNTLSVPEARTEKRTVSWHAFPESQRDQVIKNESEPNRSAACDTFSSSFMFSSKV